MTDNTANPEETAKVAELIHEGKIAIVTTVGPQGQLLSRPLALQDRDFDGDLYFFTPDPSPKTEQVKANAEVNVSIATGDGWLSLSGTGSISTDDAMIDELWSVGAKAWFEQGREDPSLALLKVHAESAEYWTMDTPTPIALLKYAKAAVAGGQPDVGESAKVEL